MSDEPANCVRVKRDGPRGWHWIAADSFDPKTHELYEDKPAIEDASAEEIVDAIGKLDAANDDHWTKAGAPDVAALVALTGKKVTRAAVDAAAKDAKRPEQA